RAAAHGGPESAGVWRRRAPSRRRARLSGSRIAAARLSGVDFGTIRTEELMAYTLDDFCADAHAILKAKPLDQALPQVAERLSSLLVNPQFVAATFNDAMPPGKRELYHDPELDFYVLAHVQEPGKTGKPHSHGTSWAIYGNAKAVTDMTEWRRVNSEKD